MKKLRLTTLAAALLPFAAAAQYAPTSGSTVQIYGRLDGSVNAVKYAGESGTRETVSTDTSLIGFRGAEDLGGGMLAYFKLEHGFNIDNGAQTSPTTFWNRESIVGLRSASFGAVELGGHWSPFIFVSGKSDPFARAQTGAQLTLFGGEGVRGYTAFYTNSILYASPSIAGATLRVMHKLPEGAATGKNTAGSLEYAQGALYVGLAYEDAQIARTTVGLVGAGPVRSRTLGLGVTYQIDSVKLFGYGQSNRVDSLKTVNGLLAGATLAVGQGEFRVSAMTTRQDDAGATLYAVGYAHHLSKRTQVYGSLGRLENKPQARFGMWPMRAEFGSPAAGQDLTGLGVGIRHLF